MRSISQVLTCRNGSSFDIYVYKWDDDKVYKGVIMDLSKSFSLVATIKGNNYIENTDSFERYYVSIPVNKCKVKFKEGNSEYSIYGDLLTSSCMVSDLTFMLEDELKSVEQLFLSIDGSIALANPLYNPRCFHKGDTYNLSVPLHYHSLKSVFGNKLIDLYENILELDDTIGELLEYNIEMEYFPSIMNEALKIHNLEEIVYAELPELNLEMFDSGTN